MCVLILVINFCILIVVKTPNGKKQFNQTLVTVVLVSAAVSLIVGFGAGMASGILVESGYFKKGISGIIPRIEQQKNSQEEETAKPYESQESGERAVIDTVKLASPAVVSVIVTKDLPVVERFYTDPLDDFNKFFGDDFFSPFRVPQYRQKGTEKREVGGGTGFIVSSDGLILTNKHVVSDTEAQYTVLTNDGEKYDATVLALDPVQDIAVLKVQKSGLPTLTLGNSDTLQIGQTVVAIGNALGEFRNTVSVGVISGLRRTIIAAGGGSSETIDEVIQTDAAINRGNSGGPLLNLKGEVIGINTAVAIGAENIGFSIPVNKAKKDLDQVQTKGKITYPFLGVRYVLVTKRIQEANKLPVDYGALVVRGENPEDLAVVPGSAADKAGVRENDIILEADGVKIDQDNTLARFIQKHNVGDTITLKVLSRGEEKTVSATLGENE